MYTSSVKYPKRYANIHQRIYERQKLQKLLQLSTVPIGKNEVLCKERKLEVTQRQVELIVLKHTKRNLYQVF